jgi:hypothetical protein
MKSRPFFIIKNAGNKHGFLNFFLNFATLIFDMMIYRISLISNRIIINLLSI